MEFGLLGPLVVTSGKTVVPVPAARQRVLLAALLFRANRVVSVDELADALWPAAPPPSARVTIQNYVKRLRHALGDAEHSRIVTRAGGYVLRAQAADFDVTRFEDLLGQAGEASLAGDWARAATRLRAGLALWRGMPLEDVPCDLLVRREVPRLEEMRLRATEARLDADLHLGLHGEVIAELRQLAADHPLRERLCELLMLALYRSGRQADALAAYRQARRLLVAELGAEPGAGLRRLHMQILAADPGLDVAPAGGTARTTAVAVPRQLPAPAAHFAGRGNELGALTGLLDSARAAAGAVPVSVISGTAGVGKTALALHWAHRVADRFPGGQLFADLRGFGPSRTAASASEVLRGFLAALGVTADRVPASLQAQAALYRSLLAGRRMLIVLDNAKDAGQVRPLLPGSSGCLVLVTSRAQLTGLAASEGAHLITLDVPSAAEARELVASRLGTQRAAGEPEAVTELIALCAGLPLALVIVAARAAGRPDFPLGVLAAELRDARHRLDALDAGDAAASVRPVFSWSLRRLSGPAARMFRLLGVHPGPDITSAASASLAGISPDQARQALSELTGASLAAEHLPGRYAVHDLLRAYAGEQAAGLEGQAECHAASHRMLDHYLHTATAGMMLIDETPWPLRPGPAQPGVVPESLDTYARAMAWFAREHHVLRSVTSEAVRIGFDVHAVQLPDTMGAHLSRTGRWHEHADLQRTALAAACRLGDQHGQARAQWGIGNALIKLGSYPSAHAHLHHALDLFGQLGDNSGRARTHYAIAVALDKQQRHGEALSHAKRALRLCQAVGDRVGQAFCLNAVGWDHALAGNHQHALSYCQRALDLHRELGHRFGEAITLDSLGYSYHQKGLYQEATAFYQQALAAYTDVSDTYFRAQTLIHLGESHWAGGMPGAAREPWRQALAILDDLHHPEASQLRARLSNVWPRL